MNFRGSRARSLGAVLISGLLLSACTSTSGDDGSSETTKEPGRPVELTSNVKAQAKQVRVDTLVTVGAENGEVQDVTLRDAAGKKSVKGSVQDGTWKATQRLEPGTSYVLTATGEGTDDKVKQLKQTFTTQALTLQQQVYPSVAPLRGETVGVGMPIIVTFDLPVKNRAKFQEHMHVRSDKRVEGSWNWLSDREVHYRPKNYWPANTKVTVDLDLNSLPAGNGIYGQRGQSVPFTIGIRMVSVVDVANHQMRVTKDGKTIRTLPVTTGDATHQTRQGTKVIMEKFDSVDMDAASTGVDADAPDYYNIQGVKWAMRLTNSGEFVHAAPWSVGSQGRANVSHGCTGMSTANAGWLYSVSKRGDIIKYVNSPRGLEDQNGWTDWNVSWSDWLEGSAIQEGADPSPTANSATTPNPNA